MPQDRQNTKLGYYVESYTFINLNLIEQND